MGAASDRAALRALAERCDVMTFDHEQVDLDLLLKLVAEGMAVRPGPATLEFAVDKAHMRTVLDEAGIPVPAYAVLEPGPDAADDVAKFASAHGWPVMLKAARGGYDGQGVWPVQDQAEAEAVLSDIAGRSWWRSWCRWRPSWPSRWPGAPRASRWPGRRSRPRRSAGSAARCWCRAGCPEPSSRRRLPWVIRWPTWSGPRG